MSVSVNAVGMALRNVITCELNLHRMEYHGAVQTGYTEMQWRELKKEMSADAEQAWQRFYTALDNFEKELKR